MHEKNLYPTSTVVHEDRKTIADHPIDPPTKSKDPWDIEFPEDRDFCIRSVDGVFNVYENKLIEHPLDYPYTKLADYIQDMNIMCQMIADGPL